MDKNCNNCKYKPLSRFEQPCSECKFTLPESDPECANRAFLWEPKTDNAVQHPSHYNHGKYECIDVMVENFGKEAVKHFCLLNAFKYVWRSNYKNGTEDVKKAMFYLDYYVSLVEGNKHGKDE